MVRKPARRVARLTQSLMFASMLILAAPAVAQAASSPHGTTPASDGIFLLTIILKHDEPKALP